MAGNANDLWESLSRQLQLSPEQIKASAQQGEADALLQHVDNEQAQRVKSVLSDPEQARALLESPQAQALMKLLQNGE